MKQNCTDTTGWKLAQEKTKKTWKEKVEQNKIDYYKSPKLCNECNDVIPYEKDKRAKFCSSSCSAKFNNKGVRRHGVGQTTALCLNCNQQFSYYPSARAGKFCSIKCNKEHQFLNETLNKFNAGLLGNSPSVMKKCIVYIHGNVCVLCKNEGTHNGIPLTLQLDHIDGNSDNNTPSNLRLLCPNCHSQTSTYKSRNKNSARAKYRRKYYKNVK